ncbi:hypothetical protein StrepF001_42770 [Streptomyces sp. F001]|nr:hypothetical protein StrepF001_42770 [Streptomyces sp. F001]
MPPYPRHLNRAILLNAIAQERRGLENGTLDQPDPRDGPAGARAHDSMAGPDAHEVSELLAALALPQESLRLLEAYEASPHAGSASVQVEIDSAIAATRILRLRLTRGASADDAWLYGPLVLAAVQSLGLSSVPAFPEFAVALGSQLGRTRTETLLSAAGLLLLGLTVVFTGPVGALAVGVLDLSFAGVELGVALLRQYERDLAASASTFRTEAEQLTPPDTDDSIPLAVAGAFLSAIGLAGAARPLLKLRARSPRQVATLELDNAVREFGTTTAEVEQAAVQAGNRRSLIRRPKPTVEMDTPGGRPLPTINDVARGLEPSTSGRTLWRSEDQMRKAAAKAKKQGGRKQLRTDGRTKERIESFALEPDEVATADRGTVRDVTEASQRETVAGTVPEREYGEADLEALSADVAPYPHLQDVPARGGATATWEGRAYDVFWKRPPENEPDLVAWARRQLPYGSPDPIAPWLIVGPKNPATLEHIVAVERIQKFHGFHRLSPANQKRVLNFRENLMALSSDVNSPLSSRTYAEWGNDIRSQVPPQFQAAFEARLAAMEAREKDLTRKLHDLIDTLLAEQNTTRGVSRPAPGRPGLGARLTGTALSTTATPEPGAEAEE